MERIEFLELENRTLNRHKGELIDKVWALESEISRLRAENERLKRELTPYKVNFGGYQGGL